MGLSEGTILLLQFREKPHVLNGDDRLVGKGLEERDLVVGEPVRLAARHAESPDRLVAAELTHPAIARPIATGILGNSPYLVEEFVEAESLDIALRVHGRAPVPDALRIATQIAGALDFA